MASENEEKINGNKIVIISIIAATLGIVSDGMHFGYSSSLYQPPYFNQDTLQNITSPNIICASDQILFRTFYMLGAMAGFLLSLTFTNIASKSITMARSLVSLLSWILLASNASLITIFIARVLAGSSITLSLLTIPTYISDIADKKLAKSLTGLIYYAMLLGVCIIYLLTPTEAYIVPPILGGLIVFIQLVLSFFMVESPYYLISNNKISEAIVTLKKLRNVEFVEKEVKIVQAYVLKRSREKRNQNLFTPIENKSASIKIILYSFTHHFSGITIFIMSLHEILHEANISVVHATITGLTFVLFLEITAFLSDINLVKRNSKTEYLSSVLGSLALISLGIYFTLNKNSSASDKLSWLPIAAIVVYGGVFRFDKGGYFPNILINTIYSESLRYRGLQLSTFIHILSAWITIELFQRLKFNGAIDILFYIFGILNFVSSITLKMWIPLTKEEDKAEEKNFEDGSEDTELIGDLQVRSSTAEENFTADMTVVKESQNIFKGTFPQLVAVLAGTLTAISDGMQYGWTAPVLPILSGPNSPVKVTKQQEEWLENLLMLGSFSGLTITMYLVDKIGRKKSILLASFVTVCIWILTALAPRVEYIFVARAFAGSAGNMAFVATPMYIAEIAEQKIRGFLSSLIYLMMLVGILLIYSVAPYIPFYAHCLIGGLLALTELCIFPFMPESPYYLLYKDQPEEAEKSLRRLRAPGMNIDKELEDIKAAVARQKEERGKLQDLILVPSNRKAMVIMAILNGAQHFSSISVLLMNSHIILKQAGSIYVSPDIAAILFALLMVIAASIASFTIDKFGRRTLLISSSLATGLCLMVLAIYFSLKNSGYNTAPVSWIPVVCVLSYALVFKLGLGMVPIVLTAELFPTKMKAYGMTLADGMYVISSLLSLQVYQRLYDNFGLEYPFYVFSVSCYIAAVFTYFFIPETKGKTLEEIQMILKGRNVEPDCKSQNLI